MSTEKAVCPICKGTGRIPKNLISKRGINFLGELFRTEEMEPFLNWAELKWRAEPDRTVTQAVHRELEIAMRALEANFQQKLKSRDGEHQKWLQNFLQKLDLKEEAKKQLIEQMQEQWRRHIEECRGSHFEADNKLTAILERLTLERNIPAKGFKFEDEAIEHLEKDFPIWEFEQIPDSKLGDCIAKPKVKNGNGEYEPTKHQILLEFTTENRVGTKKIRQLARSMKRRDITFGAIITEQVEQITKKYYPYWIEDRIAIVPFELRNIALNTFEALITMLHENGEKGKEVDWEKLKSVLNEVLEEEEDLITDILKIENNLITYSNRHKTLLTNRLQEHTKKATDRLREEILKRAIVGNH